MRLFEEDKYKDFFAPLSSKNKVLHYNCAKELIELTEKVPGELYESDMKNHLVKYIEHSSAEFNDEDGFIFSDERTVTGRAAKEIKYLRSKGWMAEREFARNGEPLANVTYDCMKLIRFIDNHFNSSNENTLSNLLLTIHDTLRDLTTKDGKWNSPRRDRPYILGIKPLCDEVHKLKDEMASLRKRIQQMKLGLSGFDKLGCVNDYILSDPAYAKLIKEYNYVTKDGYFPQYIGHIHEMLDFLTEDRELIKKMVKEYQEVENEQDEQKAAEDIEREIFFISNYFECQGYYEEVDLINKKMDEYFDLLGTRIRSIASGKKNITADLEKLLIALSDMDSEKRENILSHAFDNVFLYSDPLIVSPESIYKMRTTRRIKAKTQPVYTPVQTEKAIEDYKKQFSEHMNTKYSTRNISTFLNGLAGEIRKKELTADDVKNQDDALRLMTAFLRSHNNDLPYRIYVKDGEIKNDKFTMSNLEIERKEE